MDVRLNLDNVKKTLEDLQSRLDGRKKELQAMRQVQNKAPPSSSAARSSSRPGSSARSAATARR